MLRPEILFGSLVNPTTQYLAQNGCSEIPLDQERAREPLGNTSLADLVVGVWCGSVNVSERE